jgi:hypothetical protein
MDIILTMTLKKCRISWSLHPADLSLDTSHLPYRIFRMTHACLVLMSTVSHYQMNLVCRFARSWNSEERYWFRSVKLTINSLVLSGLRTISLSSIILLIDSISLLDVEDIWDGTNQSSLGMEEQIRNHKIIFPFFR